MNRVLLRVSVYLLVLVLFLPAYSFAQTAPQQQSFIYNSSGASADGYSLRFSINNNPGTQSTETSGNSGNLNPLAFTENQIATNPMTLIMSYPAIWDILAPSVSSCSLNAYNSSGNIAASSAVTPTSGQQTVSLESSIAPGNYSIGVGCKLSNGDTMADFLYVYVINPSSSPNPVESSFLYNGSTYNTGVDGSYTVKLSINGQPGLETIHGGSSSGNTGTINPVAFTASQFSSATIQMGITDPSGILGTGVVIPGLPSLNSCEFSINQEQNGSLVYFSGQNITAQPIETQNITLPQSPTMVAGTYTVQAKCNLSNGSSISDFDYIYLANSQTIACTSNCPVLPEPTVSINAVPMCTAAGQTTTVSWTSTNATSCVGSRGTSYPTSGYFIDSPTSQTTYEMICGGSGGSASASVTVDGSSCNLLPVGQIQGANNSTCTVSGWAYDPNDSSQSINTAVYINGPSNVGTLVHDFPANVSDPAVDSAYNISGNHGFNANLTSYIPGGKNYPLYIYGIGVSGQTALLTGSPQNIECPAASSGGGSGGGSASPSISIKGTPSGTSCNVSSGDSSFSESANQNYNICWSASDVNSCTVTEYSPTGATKGVDSCYSGDGKGPNGYGDSLSFSQSSGGAYTYVLSASGIGGVVAPESAVVDVSNPIPPPPPSGGAPSPFGSGIGEGTTCVAGGLLPCFSEWQLTSVLPQVPFCTFTANPGTIVVPQSSTLTWSCTDAKSCVDPVSGASVGGSGSDAVSPTQNTTYYLSCSNPNGSSSFAATVGVTKPYIKEVRP